MGRRRRIFGAPWHGKFNSASGVSAALVLDYSGAVGGQFFDGTSNTLTFDDLHTFTRASLATQKDSAGLVKFSPHNFLVRSDEFDQAAWIEDDTDDPIQTGPTLFGTAMWLLQDTGLGGSSQADIDRAVTGIPGTNKWAVFVKANGNSWVRLQTSLFGAGASGDTWFNITAGAGAVGTQGSEHIDAGIDDIGDGIFRVWVEILLTDDPVGRVHINLATADNLSNVTLNGSNSIWMSRGAFYASPMADANDTDHVAYVPTVAAKVYQHRLDHDKDGNRIGLLVEEERTNTVKESEAVSTTPWTTVNTPTFDLNSTVAPNGRTTADTVTDANESGLAVVAQTFSSVSNSETWCFSIFVKKDEVAPATRFGAFTLQYTLGTATKAKLGFASDDGTTVATLVDGTGVIVDSGSVDYGNYWRVWMSFTNNATGNTSIQVQIGPAFGANVDLVTPSSATTGSQILWGAQFEEGARPSSYIPTTTVAVTRAAEVCEVATSAFAFSTTVGSFAADAGGDASVMAADFATIVSSDVSDRSFLRRHFTDNDRTNSKLGTDLVDNVGGGSDFKNGAKCAGAYTTTALWVVMTGVSTGTDTGTLDIGSTTKLYIGSAQGSLQWWNSHIKEVLYYPPRLSNADLEAYVG